MSIKLTCTKIHTNQSNAFPDYFGYVRSNNDTSLLVSPLVVAGIVIGLVLFLSCVTIIIGSLRKDGGVRDWRMEADPSYDGISYAVPVGDLRSVCTGDLTPSFECGSYLDFNVAYMDSPPCYDDCVGHGVSAISLPSDDPPPYSLEDPCLPCDLDLNVSSEENAGLQQTSDTLPSDDFQVVPSSRTWNVEIVHIPLTPMDSVKDAPLQNLPLPAQTV
ncbi:protein BEAN1 isoform X1 [Pelobates fuscus]|uniref:protein BEAN1 isoform X1 n=1 Tax=Pelobates fuscus TaxID=191477 RepID=UPI002FE44E1F